MTDGIFAPAVYLRSYVKHPPELALHYGRDDFADLGRLVRVLVRERDKDVASDYPLA